MSVSVARPQRRADRSAALLVAWLANAASQWKPDALAVGGLLLVLLVVFQRVLLTNQAVIPFDAQLWHYPQEAYFVDQLVRGNFPLWIPLIYGGMPFAANMNVAMFYPINLASMLVIAHLFGYLPYRALEMIEIGHLGIAGLGTYALARHFRLNRVPAFAAGIVYMLGPFLLSEAQHLGLVESAAWIPLIALSVHRAMTSGSLKDAAVAAVFSAFCFLAGFFAAVVPVAIGLVVYCTQAVVRGFVGDQSAAYPRPILISMAIGVLGVGLCTVQLAPTAELANLAIKTERDFGVSAAPISYIITLLLPNFFNAGTLAGYWAGSDITQGYEYYGILPFLVVPLAFRPVRSALLVVLAGTATISFLLSVGANSPIVSFLVLVLPGVITRGAYGFPFRVILDLCVALLVALGIEALLSMERVDPPGAGWQILRAIAGTIAVVLITFIVASYVVFLVQAAGPSGAVSDTIRGRLDAIVTDGLTQLLVLVWSFGAIGLVRRNPKNRAAQGIVLATLVVPLFLAGSGKAMNTGNASPGALRTRVPAPAVYLRQAMTGPAAAFRFDRTDGEAQLWGTLTELWDLPSANGNDPFLLADYQTYRDAFVTEPQGARTVHAADYRSRLADLLGIRYVVVQGNAPERQTLSDPGHWKEVYQGPGEEDVFENQRVLPRAFVVGAARSLPPANTLSALTSPGFDPTREVLLTASATTDLTSAEPAHPSARAATYAAVSPDRVDVRVDAGPPGWLVVTDVYYPGWVARVDGQAVPVERADFLFRAVRLDGRPQTVTFTFEPPSIRLGLIVTTITWIVTIAIIVGSALPRFTTRNRRT